MSSLSDIDPIAISRIRLNSPQLDHPSLTHPKKILSWMVAIQAQDYPMAKWAIGARLLGSTEHDIETAIDNAQVIRTHLLRPTWHFVAAEDIYWLLDLSAERLKHIQATRDRQLELTEEIYSRSNSIIENSLREGLCLTRAELVAELNKAKIATDENRASHLFARAELEKIICSGSAKNGKPTYTLLSKWVRKGKTLTKDDALFTLAKRYFISRCPATIQDFAWWSGLNAADVRYALELIEQDFYVEKVQEQTYLFPNDFSLPPAPQRSIHLLPTYDELMISYADRRASVPTGLEQHMRMISDRGIFRPIIVQDGQVIGIWKRTIDKKRIAINVHLFSDTDRETMEGISTAVDRYSSFINQKLEFKIK